MLDMRRDGIPVHAPLCRKRLEDEEGECALQDVVALSHVSEPDLAMHNYLGIAYDPVPAAVNGGITTSTRDFMGWLALLPLTRSSRQPTRRLGVLSRREE